MDIEKIEHLQSLGDASFKHREYHQALAYYSEGLEINPEVEELLGCRCAVYQKLHMFHEAVKDAERLIKVVPFKPKGYYLHAVALENLGSYNKSLLSYLKAYENDPRHPEELLISISQVSRHLDTTHDMDDDDKDKGKHFQRLSNIGKRMLISREFKACDEIMRTALRGHIYMGLSGSWLHQGISKRGGLDGDSSGDVGEKPSTLLLDLKSKVLETSESHKVDTFEDQKSVSSAGDEMMEQQAKLLIVSSTDAELQTLTSTLLVTAQALIELQKYQPALAFAKQALDLSLQHKNIEYEMKSYIKIANIYQRLGNYLQAISFNAKILAVGQDLSESESTNTTFWNSEVERKAQWNLCACYRILRNYEAALKHAKQYLEIVKLVDQESLIDAYINLGQIEILFGNSEKALECFMVELSICKKFKDRLRISYAYGHIGNAYASHGYFQQALTYHNQHLQVAKAMNDRASETEAMKNFGDMYRLRGDTEKAGEFYDKQLRLAKINGIPSLECLAYRSWGQCSFESELFHKAQYLVENALNIVLNTGEFEEQLECKLLLAKILKKLSQFENARQYYNQVIPVLEHRINMKKNGQILLHDDVQKQLDDCYRELLEILADMNCYDEALEISEHCHNRLMVNLLKKKQILKPDSKLRNLDLDPLNFSEILQTVEQQDAMFLFFSVIDSGIILWVITPQKGVVKVHRFRNTPGKVIEQLIKQFISDLHSPPYGSEASYFCEHRALPGKDSRTSAETGQCIGKGSATSSGRSSKSLSTPSPRESKLTPLQEVYMLLITPLDDLLISLPEGTKMYIVTDSFLNLVPFASLQNFSGKFMHQRFSICTLPCIRALQLDKLHASSEVDVPKGDILVAGNPVIKGVKLREQMWAPPMQSDTAEREINLISSILGADPLSGAQATKDDILKRLPDASVVHFATLGDLNAGSLVFTPNAHHYGNMPTEESYLMTLEDLSSLDLQAKVVVVSAGHSCSHDLDHLSSFTHHLAMALLVCGVSAVMMPQWSVSSYTLQQIWYHFYHGLDKGFSVLKSLNKAVLVCQSEDDAVMLSDLSAFQFIGFDSYVSINMLEHSKLDETVDEQKGLVSEILPQTIPQILQYKFPPVSEKLLQIQKYFYELLANHPKNSQVLPQISALLNDAIHLLSTPIHETINKPLTTQVKSSFLNVPGCHELFKSLGFSFQPSGVDEDQLMVIYPHWDCDKLLESGATITQNICDILEVSDYSAYALSRIFPTLDKLTLGKLNKLFELTSLQPEKLLKVDDVSVKSLWLNQSLQNLLTSLGYYVVGGTLLFNKTSSNRALLKCLLDIVLVLLECYKTEKQQIEATAKLKFVDGHPVKMASLSPTITTARNIVMSTPWMTRKSNSSEIKLKTQVTKRLIDVNKDFRSHRTHAQQWHNNLIKSQDPIAPIPSKHLFKRNDNYQENLNETQDSVTKVKVVAGFTPSFDRVPVDRKPNMTLDLVNSRRTGINRVFEQRYEDILLRKKHDVRQLFLPHLVMEGKTMKARKGGGQKTF